jgi:hypothetical protein
MKIGIAVIAFNKINPLKRLLSSLANVDLHGNVNIDLCFCIDGGGASEIATIANDYMWQGAEKRIFIKSSNIGLKKNVYETMKLGLEYDALIILEDDLYVSTQLIKYVENILTRYKDLNNIAGFSLYAAAFNETAYCNFKPINDGSDVFFMKVPSSWGQLYTKQQIKDYFVWLDELDNLDLMKLPENVARWSVKSWKKEFFAYLIQANKYLIYPRSSITTNYADAGEHHKGSDIYQVPLCQKITDLNLFDFEISNAVYDEYCELEPHCINRLNGKLSEYNYITDLYGFKISTNHIESSDYVLSAMKLRNPVRSWADSLIPLEMNIISDAQGEGLYLYKIDTLKILRIALIKSRIKVFLKLHNIRLDLSLISRLLGRN